MDFTLNEEQQLLADSLSRFIEDYDFESHASAPRAIPVQSGTLEAVC